MFLPPIAASDPEAGETGGHSYGAVILPGDEAALDAAVDALRGIGFSGWIAPPRDGSIVIVGQPGGGVVAGARRGIIEVAGVLAEHVPGAVLGVRVLRDRQLALVAWSAGEEVGRYCSDPSIEPTADKEVLTEPVGAEHGETFAALWGRADAAGADAPDTAEALVELLEDELDPDSTSESERLGTVLRMLGLPSWLVAAGELPRAMPNGPRPGELVRLRAGRTGIAGLLLGLFVSRVRRRKSPPQIISDPPTGGGMGYESWMY